MREPRSHRAGTRGRRIGLALALCSLVPGGVLAQSAALSTRPLPEFRPRPQIEGHLTFDAPPEAPPSRASRPAGPADAFRAELRHEAIDYHATNPWAQVSEDLRGDRPVREARSRAAESMLADAAGAAAEVLLRDLMGRPRRFDSDARPGVRADLRVDASPSCRLRCRAGGTTLRLELPLSAHEPIRFRHVRPVLDDRFQRSFATSVSLDPWDSSVRLGFEYEF